VDLVDLVDLVDRCVGRFDLVAVEGKK